MARTEKIGAATLYLGDCREILPTLGKVDAVVTDPPYGINAARDRNSQEWGWTDFPESGWDKERAPGDLIEMAVAAGKHAIVWGGNYWSDVLPPTDKWLSWDKGQIDFSLADFELAWCSFPGAARRIAYPRALALRDGKEHPTQKPIKVMRWCLDKLPRGCRSILDPFMGSGTTGVAAVTTGHTFIGIEASEHYFDVACRRISAAQSAGSLFAQHQEALL